jgi:hypothetical protein
VGRHLDTAGSVDQIGRRLPFVPADVKFPPYQQIIPAVVVDRSVTVTYDPTYLADVGAAFAEVSNREGCGITLQPCAGELDPVVITSDTSSALAILMPRRSLPTPRGAALLAKFRGEKPSKAA